MKNEMKKCQRQIENETKNCTYKHIKLQRENGTDNCKKIIALGNFKCQKLIALGDFKCQR